MGKNYSVQSTACKLQHAIYSMQFTCLCGARWELAILPHLINYILLPFLAVGYGDYEHNAILYCPHSRYLTCIVCMRFAGRWAVWRSADGHVALTSLWTWRGWSHDERHQIPWDHSLQ